MATLHVQVFGAFGEKVTNPVLPTCIPSIESESWQERVRAAQWSACPMVATFCLHTLAAV